MQYNRERWLVYAALQDGHPKPNEPGYEEHIASVNENFDCNSVDRLLQIDRITIVFSERFVG